MECLSYFRLVRPFFQTLHSQLARDCCTMLCTCTFWSCYLRTCLLRNELNTQRFSFIKQIQVALKPWIDPSQFASLITWSVSMNWVPNLLKDTLATPQSLCSEHYFCPFQLFKCGGRTLKATISNPTFKKDRHNCSMFVVCSSQIIFKYVYAFFGSW